MSEVLCAFAALREIRIANADCPATPLAVYPPHEYPPRPARRQATMSARSRFVVGLVLLGLALRGYHYLRGPSMWHDEAAVAVNVLDKDYQGLLGPLRFHEAAPPLFLWVE